MVKNLLTFLAIFSVWFSVSISADVISESAYAEFKKGEELASQGRYEEALSHFKEASKIDPYSSVVKEWLGFCYVNLNNYDDAINIYMSVSTSKLSTDSLANLGFAYLKKNNIPSAIAYLSKAVAKDPNHRFALNNLGLAYIANKEAMEAENCLRHATELYPDFSEAWNNLGIALRMRGKVDDALTCFKKSISLNPNIVDTYYNIAVVYKLKEMTKEAGDYFAKYLQRNPDNQAMITEAVDYLRKIGRLTEIPKELR
ncbi:MAG: tetratricopeptide repeat protein [bacterium]